MLGVNGRFGKWWRSGLAVIGGLAIAPIISIPAQAADRIIEIRGGAASVTKVTGRGYPALVGTLLWAGDRLRPERGTVVVVRCDNGTLREIRYVAGLGTICPDSVGIRTSNTGRGEDDFLSVLFGTFDYGTQVMEAMPTLRWNGVEGATMYKVQVWSGDEMLWETEEDGVQAPYEGVGLDLGQRYQMIVTALAGEEVLERSRILLRRLGQDEAETVGALVERTKAAELSGEGRSLALAQLYVDVGDSLLDPPDGSGLVWQGIEELEVLVEQGNETPFTHQLLGDLYLQVGLLEQAKGQYERVLELTRRQDDVRTRAAAWVGLANLAAADSFVAYEMDDAAAVAVAEAEAREYLAFAVINYRVLDETSRVEKIEEEWLTKVGVE